MDSLLSLRADLRDAVRPPSDENVNAAFRKATIEPLAQRANRTQLELCDVRSQCAPEVRIFRSKYTRALLSRIQTDVSPIAYRPFDNSMGRIYIHCGLHFERQLIRGLQRIEIRPLSVLRRERLQRSAHAPLPNCVSNRPGANRPLAGSPRTRMSTEIPPRNTFRVPDETQELEPRDRPAVRNGDHPFSDGDISILRRPPILARARGGVRPCAEFRYLRLVERVRRIVETRPNARPWQTRSRTSNSTDYRITHVETPFRILCENGH